MAINQTPKKSKMSEFKKIKALIREKGKYTIEVDYNPHRIVLSEKGNREYSILQQLLLDIETFKPEGVKKWVLWHGEGYKSKFITQSSDYNDLINKIH